RHEAEGEQPQVEPHPALPHRRDLGSANRERRRRTNLRRLLARLSVATREVCSAVYGRRMLDTTNTSSAAASATADSPFTILRKTRFAGLEFPKPILTKAGKILKSHGEEAALTFLEGKGEVEPCNARPPAKCEIVAISRPFAEWPISIVSADR